MVKLAMFDKIGKVGVSEIERILTLVSGKGYEVVRSKS
jgi:hypothetical protein